MSQTLVDEKQDAENAVKVPNDTKVNYQEAHVMQKQVEEEVAAAKLRLVPSSPAYVAAGLGIQEVAHGTCQALSAFDIPKVDHVIPEADRKLFEQSSYLLSQLSFAMERASDAQGISFGHQPPGPGLEEGREADAEGELESAVLWGFLAGGLRSPRPFWEC